MGTSCIVGLPTDDGKGFRGRYVHYDGYPAGVGVALAQILTRDGYGKAVQTLLVDHYGWSQVSGLETPSATFPDDVIVFGYGVAFSTGDHEDVWYRDSGELDSNESEVDGLCQWAYAMLANRVLVWECDVLGDGTWKRRTDLDIPIPVKAL